MMYTLFSEDPTTFQDNDPKFRLCASIGALHDATVEVLLTTKATRGLDVLIH